MTAIRGILQTARIACGCVLLCFFLWTAQFVFYGPWIIVRYVIALPEWVLSLNASDPSLEPFRIIDFLCLALLIVVTGATFLLGRRRGRTFALLRATQVGSMMMVLLGLAILAFNPGQLWVYVTLTQHETGLLPWFTNGASLISSGVLFGLATYGVREHGRYAPWSALQHSAQTNI